MKSLNIKRIISIIAITVVCMGCGESEAKTKGDFTGFAEAKGMVVSDRTEQFENDKYIEQALVANAPDEAYQIEFYILDSDESACVFYQENYEFLSKNEKDAKNHANTSNKTVQSYEITGAERYGCVTRIGNTCFYALVDKAYKEKVKDFKESYGY